MRGQSANERRTNLADAGWAPYGGVSYERSQSLRRNDVQRGLGPAWEATVKSGAIEFPAQLHERAHLPYLHPARTNESPMGSIHLGGIQIQVTTSHASVTQVRLRFLVLTEEKSERTSPTLHPKPHTRSKIIPL